MSTDDPCLACANPNLICATHQFVPLTYVATGWICPVCRGGVAPGVERCPCVAATLGGSNGFVYAYSTPFCEHEYPFPWHSVLPPACLRCGERAQGGTVFSVAGPSAG